MPKKRIYVDSCVLITAFKAEPEVSDAALALLDDDDVEYLYSRISELEVLPMPTHNRRHQERQFYLEFFQSAVRVPCTEDVIDKALQIGEGNGLSAADALHVACAVAAGADELVTNEKKTRLPQARAGVPIRSLRPS